MGLAASQARLLTLTSRAIDLEMRCLTLSAATLRNAQESYDLSQEHNDQLDALDEASKDPNSEFYIGMKATSYTVNGTAASIGNMDPSRLENISPFNVDYVVNNNGGTIEHSKYIKDGKSTKSTRTETAVKADIQSTTTSKNNNTTKLNNSKTKLDDLKAKSDEWEYNKNNSGTISRKNGELQAQIYSLKTQRQQYVNDKTTAEGVITAQDAIISQQTAEATKQAGIASTNKASWEGTERALDAIKAAHPNDYRDRYDYQQIFKQAGQFSAAWHQAEAFEKMARQKVEAAEKEKAKAEGDKSKAEANIASTDASIEALEKQIVPVSDSPSASNPYTSQIATEQANYDMYQQLVDNDTKKLEELNNELAQVQQPYTQDEQDLLKTIKEDTTGTTFLKALKDGTISIVGPDGKVLNYEDVKKDYNKNNFLPEDDMDSASPNIQISYSKDKSAYDTEKARIDREFDQEEKKLSLKDKKIQAEQTQVQTQLNAVNTERESVKSLIDKNVEKGFKYGYNA